jgi:hypothetical protein
MAARRVMPLIAVLIAGCTSHPRFGAETLPAADGYPALVPVETLRAAAAPQPAKDGATTRVAASGARAATAATSDAASVEDRAARLRARAARLRGGEVLDASARKRLDAPVEIEDGGA